MKKVPLSLAVTTALLISTAPVVNAQEGSALDIGRMAVGGYGDVTYIDQNGVNNNVVSRFVPIFLFQLSEKIHIESELEFTVNAVGETVVEMEYADLHYFFNDNTTITAGKFLLPFGQFGPNLHPSWINKLPAVPGLYGHGGNGSITPLIPVMSDTGVNVSNTFQIGSAKLFTDFYMVSGPREEVVGGNGPGIYPEPAFESAKGDNNDDKAFGGRVAIAVLPQWEFGYSFYSGAYDSNSLLNYSMSALDFNWLGSFSSVRGEIINTTTEGFRQGGGTMNWDRNGWYVQGTWQLRQLGKDWLNPLELVLRRSKITEIEAGQRWTIGLDYWLEPSAALKLAYEDTKLESGISDNRLMVQLAFGF